MNQQTEYDLIILGGGPAGMTAAIYAARANLRTIILEENVTGGLVNSTYTVENFPSYGTIHGMDLMEKMRAHVDSLGVEVEEVCEVEALALDGPLKKVETDEGTLTAKAVIIATGRSPIPLDLPTECNEVHHCAICDGGPYKGKRVLVVGGGNSAFDEGLYLQRIGIDHITLVEEMDCFFAAKATQDEFLASDRVDARVETKVVDLALENGILARAVLENVRTGEQEVIPVDGVFVFLGQHPNNGLFRETIDTNDQGYILAKTDMATNIPGVYSVGDINDKPFRQITTAMADGTVAALAIERYLRTPA